MKDLTSSSAERIINEKVTIFLNEIRQACQITNKRIHTENSDFPLFYPANRDFFEYKYYQGVLEWYIRDYLVTPILCGLFKAANIEVVTPDDSSQKGVIRAKLRYDNASYGRDYPFAFKIQSEDSFVGIRYSGFDSDNAQIMGLLSHHRLKRIEIIDWQEADSMTSKKTEYSVNIENRDKVYYVTLKHFFLDYFAEEVYRTFLTKIRDAVEIANKEIGFQTIPSLSLRYLSDFREASFDEISSMPLQSMRYRIFDTKTGEPTDTYYDCLPNEDSQIVKMNLASDGLMRALVGNEPFARCFITSEYLYKIFEKGNEKSFDYSAIATGYFKSVELLLMKIVKLALDFQGSEKLWIKTTNTTDPIDYVTYGKKRKNKTVIFKKEHEEEFSTEMGPLIWFLHDWPTGWSIFEKGRQLVHKCLLNYNKGCRNEHLHKDIISDIMPAIKGIRENTILCLYYLLGGCKLTENPDDRGSAFDVYSGVYNRLYKVLQGRDGIPASVNRFYIQFPGKKQVKAIRLYQQDDPDYSAQGDLQSGIKFIIVDDFAHIDYEELVSTMTTDNTIVISQDNMPERMWFHHPTNGPVEIEW